MDPVAAATFPYENVLPSYATFYLLLRRPDFVHTPIGRHINALAGGGRGRSFDENELEAVLEDHEIDSALTDITVRKRVVISLLSIFLTLQEDVQDTILEEIFAFTPLVFGPLLSALPQMGGDGGRGSTETALVLVLAGLAAALCLVLNWLYLKLKSCLHWDQTAKVRRLESQRSLIRSVSNTSFKRTSLSWF